MPDGLYERDALAWAEQQAALLRRLAAGERVNADVDWANVIEEVGDVGLSELHACQSLLTQAMIHLLKLHLEPDAPSTAHWRGEVVTFLADAQARFTPSMRQRLVLDRLWANALRRIRVEEVGGDGVLGRMPTTCPFTADDLVEGEPEVAALVGRLAGAG